MKRHGLGRVKTQFHEWPRGLRLACGDTMAPMSLAYETYGRLSSRRDNAVLVFHALTGSQHAAGFNPKVPGLGSLWTEECQHGWWNEFIGPGRALDTRKYFVVCANYLGGCYGSTGPFHPDPRTGRKYAAAFPPVTLGDIVDSQVMLLDHLGIRCAHAATGGSLGGMLAVSFATRYPDRVRLVIPIASGIEVTPMQRILNFEQIYAITEDQNFRGGDYYGRTPPDLGMALARMISHKTFVSLKYLLSRLKRQRKTRPLGACVPEQPEEHYLMHQGRKLIRRFDANTYIRIMRAWQNFDLLKEAGASSYRSLFARSRRHGQKWLLFSIDSDECFFPEQQAHLTKVLRDAKVEYQHITVSSEKGHDSFLIEPALYTPHLAYFLGLH